MTRNQIDRKKRSEDFQSIFSASTYSLKEELFTVHSNSFSRFDHLCECTLNAFSKKWHPIQKCLEYIETFSISKWNDLSASAKEHHTLANCHACYHSYRSLQLAYPNKPIFEPHTIVRLPSVTTEKDQARSVLGELNQAWHERFSHTFTHSLPTVLPECNLTKRKTKAEVKKEDRVRKRKIVQHVNDHYSENMAMVVLAEAESLASYGRKRLALSYEKPNVPPKSKSHSPNEQNMTWDIQNAVSELESFPSTTKVNWSEMARKYNIPGKNAGQVLKETAKNHGIDTFSLEHNPSNTPRIRRHKCRLRGGEISMPCLPTINTVKEEQKALILSGELNIGEPCTPFSMTKSVVTKDGNIEFSKFVVGKYHSVIYGQHS